MATKVKICGITDTDAIEAAIDHNADYVGFVFYRQSPRNITPANAASLASLLPKNIKSVAVMVDPDDADISNMLKEFTPDYIQLHGSETPDRIYDIHMKFSLPVIKAIKVRSSDDVAKALNYTDIADMLLFDSKASADNLPGGNGLMFDWSLLKSREFKLPWFLSGGININNVEQAISTTSADAIDVSSSLEIEPGTKDTGLIKEFMKRAKSDE